jgi:5-methyltetrahydropteroyltriglutamate--homocysteine methyltransferase
MDNLDLAPFRADQVGSLLRPKALLEARKQFAQGSLEASALRELEDAAIADAIAKQEAVGLRSATDGEFRRESWLRDFTERVKGKPWRGIGAGASGWFNREGRATDLQQVGMEPPAVPPEKASGDRLGLDGVIFGEDFAFVREHTTTALAKLCIPSPSMLHFRAGDGNINREVYPDLEEFWSDMVELYVQELQGLSALGCSYLQLDDTSLAFMADPREQEKLVARGDDMQTLSARYVETMNRIVARRPEGMMITLHTCRGNNQSSWAASGGYEPIAETVFGGLKVDGLFLEFDDERSGGFEPLRFVDQGCRVVLGIVSSKIASLEGKSELKRRVEEASKVLPLDQLCLSPQCGFASTEPGNRLTEEEEFAKLRLVVETADEIWT